MKKIASLSLVLTLLVSFLAGCNNNSVSTQSDFSDDVILQEVIIDNTSSDSNVVSSNVETPDEPTVDNSSINSVSTNNSFTNNSSTNNSSVVSSNTNNSSVNDSSTGNSSINNTLQNESSQVDSASCFHSYDDGKIEKTAQFFAPGTKKYTCKKCGDSYTNTYPVEKIKILSIGNSFSLNSMWNLYDICKAAGVKEIDIAIMYIGGCSLDKHWENAQNNSDEYQLYRNNDGEWKITPNYTLEKILQEKDWDIITLQNKSEHAAEQDKFSNVDNMVNYVSDKCPAATLLWHMTWAFTKDSQYLDDKYHRDDTLMFKNITECAQTYIVPNSKIKGIVPVGTAIMNARTSSLKKELHLEDGSHLSEEVGYYVGAITWYRYLTGQSPYDFNYSVMTPSINKNIPMFIETAENAVKNPYQITNSSF
ncbi:MAG: DUF4886 domain-containing protein [Clostridia bacterium]|nr:DUF4886 domain-containing protein [Clostridia bacterium]